MTASPARRRLLAILAGMRRKGADFHDLQELRAIARQTPGLPPEFHRHLSDWAEDFDEIKHAEDLRVIARLEALLTPAAAPPSEPLGLEPARRTRALHLLTQMRKITRGAARLDPAARKGLQAALAGMTDEIAREVPRRAQATAWMAKLRAAVPGGGAEIGPLARRAEELGQLIDGPDTGQVARTRSATDWALTLANLSLLVLFPVAWFAPLMRAGLLPVFGLSEISVISGLQELWKTDVVLALLVSAFALFAPYLKTIGLGLVHFHLASPRILGALHVLGKLAMADVFLIALYIVVVKGVGLARVETAWGLYLFTGCILASLAISIVTERRLKKARQA